MDEIQPPFEEKINIEDLVLSSNQTEMQDVRNNSMSIEIKQERVEYHTKFLHVENENTLLRKKLEESMNLQKVVTEKLASSVIKIQQIQGEKNETIANFTKSEVEKDKLRVELTRTKHEFEKSLVRIEKLKSQNQKYKEVISVLISAQDESSKEIQFKEQDTDSNDHIDAMKIPENELDLKTVDQSKVRDQPTVVKISIRKKNNHLKTKSNDREQRTDIDENTKTLEEIANFDDVIKRKEKKYVRQSKAPNVRKQSHSVQKLFQCEYCEKGFNSKSLLKRHEMIHTGGKPFSCQYCEKCFNRSSTLKVHQRIHSGERPHPCKTCKKCFVQKSNLKYHELIHHGGEKPLIHDEERSQKVDIDENTTSLEQTAIFDEKEKRQRKFVKRSKCHNVLKQSHEVEKKFDCKYCGKGFTNRSHSNEHERIHTGEKPFKCSYCSKQFRQSSALLKCEKFHKRKNNPTSKE